MGLKDWVANGWVTEHSASIGEITELLDAAHHDLENCRVEGLSADWRLQIAYSAALKAAIAALAFSGYRASRERHHYIAIQSLAHTIHADENTIAVFDAMRKKRNVSSYDRMGTVSDFDAERMAALAVEVIEKVKKHIQK